MARLHTDEVNDMCRELASFVRYTLSVSLFSGIDERLGEYAERMEFLPTSIKDFEFRNGYFYKYSKLAGDESHTNESYAARESCVNLA